MTTTITIDKQFRNLRKACLQDDSRPVLNAVYIDPAGKAVASDGFIMAVVPAEITDDPLPYPGLLIPVELWRLALRITNAKAHLGFTWDGDLITVDGGHLSISGSPVTGTYPDWQNLLKREAVSGKTHAGFVAFDPSCAARLAAALGPDRPCILRTTAKSLSPLWMYAGEGMGIMMPMAVSHETWADALAEVSK